MTYEERENYYINEYVEHGELPKGISILDFFDKDLLNFIHTKKSMLYGNDFVTLIKAHSNNNEIVDILISLVIESKIYGISLDEFNNLFKDKELANKLMNCLMANPDKVIEKRICGLILASDNLLDQIINNNLINANLFRLFFNAKLPKKTILKLIKDKRFLDILCGINLKDFLYFTIKKYDIGNELSSLIVDKINNSSYMDRIISLKNYYDSNTEKPEYLKELYKKYEDVISSSKKRTILVKSVSKMTDEETKKLALEILSTEEGQSILLRGIIEPIFSEIVNAYNLDKILYKKRKETLLNELNNYHKYDLNTIKDIFCLYCFDDIAQNSLIRIKTLLEYAKDNDEAALLINDNIEYFNKVYSFITNNQLECNPLDIVKQIDLNNLLAQAHAIFSNEVNQKTSIKDVLKNRKGKEINGVRIIDVDFPREKSMFLVHVVSKEKYSNSPLETYKRSSMRHGKICMSVLHDNTQVFNSNHNPIIFGYCDINMPLYSALSRDAQTNQRGETYRPQYRSHLTSLDKFVKSTITYNELAYYTNNEILMPSYILVIDREPSEIEINVAKEFEIPILIHHRKNIEQNISYQGQSLEVEPYNYERVELDYIPNEIIEERKSIKR